MELSVKNQRFKNVCQLLAKARSFQNNPKNWSYKVLTATTQLIKTALFTEFPVNAAKFTLARLDDL